MRVAKKSRGFAYALQDANVNSGEFRRKAESEITTIFAHMQINMPFSMKLRSFDAKGWVIRRRGGGKPCFDIDRGFDPLCL